MNKRKFRRNHKPIFERTGGRAQQVFAALMAGKCVECNADMEQVSSSDPDYQGETHMRCPVCEWQAVTESGGTPIL